MTEQALSLKPRDRRTFQYLSHCRALTARQMARLLGGNERAVQRRCRLLCEARYLNQLKPVTPEFYGRLNLPNYYSLADKAADEIKAPRKKRNLNDQRLTSLDFVQHEIDIAEVLVQVEVVARADKTLVHRSQHQLLQSDVIKLPVLFQFNNQIIDMDVEPDGHFALHKVATRPLYYFLELDRGSEPMARSDLTRSCILQKLIAVDALLQRHVLESRLGIKSATWLFVANDPRDPDRAAKMLDLLKDAPIEHKQNFAFTEMAALRKHGPLAPIWQSVNGPIALPHLTIKL